MTDPKIMSKFKPCLKCKEIPLPQYRSYKSQDKVYCKNCYVFLNFNPDFLVHPTDIEYELLEELVIKCINENCEETFNIFSLEDFISHKSDCKYVSRNNLNKCKKCNSFYKKTESHDCYSIIFKNISDLITRQDKLESETTETIDSNNDKLEKKINDLENIVINQNKSIDTLKQIVSKLEFNLNNHDLSVNTPGNHIRVNNPTEANGNQLRRNDMENENKIRIFKDNKQNSFPIKDINDCINLNQNLKNEERCSEFDHFKTSMDSNQDFKSKSIMINNRRPINRLSTSGETLKKEENNLNYSTIVKPSPKVINEVKNFYHLTTLKGHEKTVKSLIQLSDNRIASGSYDKSIKFWDLDRIDDPITFNSFSNDIYSLAEICEGRLAFASGNNIKIFDIKNQRILNELKNHKKYVNSVINIGKDMLASASKDGSIRVWDLNKSKCVSTFQSGEEHFNSIILLKDGS